MAEAFSAEEIREQMAQVRREMSLNYGEAIEHARDLADWRHYVRNYPWATLALAAALGYAVVPNRVELIHPEAGELVKLARRQKLVVEPKPTPEPKVGVGTALFNMLASMLVRGAVAYLGQRLGKTAGEETAQSEEGDRIRSF